MKSKAVGTEPSNIAQPKNLLIDQEIIQVCI